MSWGRWLSLPALVAAALCAAPARADLPTLNTFLCGSDGTVGAGVVLLHLPNAGENHKLSLKWGYGGTPNYCVHFFATDKKVRGDKNSIMYPGYYRIYLPLNDDSKPEPMVMVCQEDPVPSNYAHGSECNGIYGRIGRFTSAENFGWKKQCEIDFLGENVCRAPSDTEMEMSKFDSELGGGELQ